MDMDNLSLNKSGFRLTSVVDPISRESLQPIADHINDKITIEPKLGIICGSGLGGLASLVEDSVVLNYADIPGFPVSTAPGHHGRLVTGVLCGVPVLLMQGRFHVYEGYPLWMCTMPIRIMKLLGVKMMIVSNAVGGLNQNYKVGDVMLVKDHINFFGIAGDSPLRGPNDLSFGPRFFSVNDIYDSKWRSLALDAAEEVGMKSSVHEGVLTITAGPNFESAAELKMFSMLGVDCVGMSSIPECLTAHHCGLQVLAFSLVTNQCNLDVANMTSAAPSADEVLDVAAMKENDMKNFVSAIVRRLSIHLK